MKLSKSPSRITGVHLGELAINLMPQNQKDGTSPPILAKFAIVREDGSFCGSYTKINDFSPKTIEALQNFISSVEEDALSVIFQSAEGETPEQPAGASEEPPQF